jgi:hypothetical protein
VAEGGPDGAEGEDVQERVERVAVAGGGAVEDDVDDDEGRG